MIKEAFEYIVSQREPRVFEIDGRKYTDKALDLIIDPLPAILKVNTLAGLVDYYKLQLGSDSDSDHTFLHIVDHGDIRLQAGLNTKDQNRKIFLQAILPRTDGFAFGRWHDIETFIIELQAKFELSQQTQALLAMVANIKDENIKTNTDDGYSQSVTVKTGAVLIKEQTVANPVILQPYRTFIEVVQPPSPFIFRLKKQTGELTAALFEADGGRWQLEAIANIKKYLNDSLPGAIIIA